MSRWELNFSSPVDEILKKSEFTLEDLLDEDETVVDVRNGKELLISLYAFVFFRNVFFLICYITLMLL